MAAVSQTDGIGLTTVDALTTLLVRTDNSLYQITILKPYAREVLVQGGAFFPARTRACLSGSSFGGSCLKLGWVGLGLHMECLAGEQWVITSHVRSIAVESAVASGSREQACERYLRPSLAVAGSFGLSGGTSPLKKRLNGS